MAARRPHGLALHLAAMSSITIGCLSLLSTDRPSTSSGSVAIGEGATSNHEVDSEAADPDNAWMPDSGD